MSETIFGLNEHNIKRAYKNGCDDVKKTLEDLFPSLELGAKPKDKFYSMGELSIELKENPSGQFIRIKTPIDNLTSACHCKEEGEYIWVPFYKYEGMRLGRKDTAANFRILKE